MAKQEIKKSSPIADAVLRFRAALMRHFRGRMDEYEKLGKDAAWHAQLLDGGGKTKELADAHDYAIRYDVYKHAHAAVEMEALEVHLPKDPIVGYDRFWCTVGELKNACSLYAAYVQEREDSEITMHRDWQYKGHRIYISADHMEFLQEVAGRAGIRFLASGLSAMGGEELPAPPRKRSRKR